MSSKGRCQLDAVNGAAVELVGPRQLPRVAPGADRSGEASHLVRSALISLQGGAVP